MSDTNPYNQLIKAIWIITGLRAQEWSQLLRSYAPQSRAQGWLRSPDKRHRYEATHKDAEEVVRIALGINPCFRSASEAALLAEKLMALVDSTERADESRLAQAKKLISLTRE